MALSVIIEATELPVSLSEAKQQCRLVESDDAHNALLLDLIWDAAATIESKTDCKTSETTLELVLDEFPAGDIDIPIYPLISVTSVKYDDPDDAEQTLAGTEYWVRVAGYSPLIRPVTAWPATKACKPAAVRIRFVVGFTASTLPKDLKRAIRLRISELFNSNSESETGREVYATINTVDALVHPHRKAYL